MAALLPSDLLTHFFLPRTLQDASGRFRTPQDASGRLRKLQDASGRVSTLQDAWGSFSALQDASGRLGTPQDASGRFRTPQDASLTYDEVVYLQTSRNFFLGFSGSAKRRANPNAEIKKRPGKRMPCGDRLRIFAGGHRRTPCLQDLGFLDKVLRCDSRRPG